MEQWDFSKMTVTQIREVVGQTPHEALLAILDKLDSDRRASVRNMASSARRHWQREETDRDRVRQMYALERELAPHGLVLGVDEVGRGSVAGPLTVAAVALPDEPIVWGIDDSKKLTPLRREELTAQIAQVAQAIGIAHIPPEEIDRCGMAACLRKAMGMAIENSGVDPAAVLIDGLPVHVHPKEITLTHGDARISCIAAASIVAKVTRDAIMVQADARYPGYDFAGSKGYASPKHIAAIRAHGLTDYHRATFCNNFLS